MSWSAIGFMNSIRKIASRSGPIFCACREQWPIGMPVCRSLGKGLWEVRTDLSSNRTARVLFFVDGDGIGVVHGFVKKTRKTPEADLELVRKRMKET
jgi:phage-related protein